MSFRRVNKVQREVEARILPPMPCGESLRCRGLNAVITRAGPSQSHALALKQAPPEGSAFAFFGCLALLALTCKPAIHYFVNAIATATKV